MMVQNLGCVYQATLQLGGNWGRAGRHTRILRAKSHLSTRNITTKTTTVDPLPGAVPLQYVGPNVCTQLHT